MSPRKPQGPQVAGNRLVVPDVEPGDIGLVIVVHGVVWDSHTHRWWVIAPETHMYRVPQELGDWARQLEHDARRRYINLPAAFAFRRADGQVTVQKLSSA